MRILHLSDIHFSAHNIDSFEQYYVNAICNDLIALNQDKKIDAICLTGDLIDKGGLSFGSPKKGYESFLTNFWNPIAQRVGLDNNSLFIIPGNHDINEKNIDEYYETGMLEKLINIQSIDSFVEKRYSTNNIGIERQNEFKQFENDFYKSNLNSEVTNFESCHILELPIGLVGFACINTSWRCSTSLPSESLVFGTIQIRRAAKYLKDKGCKYIIGLLHHPLDFISDIERNETSSLLQSLGYNAVLLGHTHHGKTSFSENNNGDLFISTARTGFSNPNQEIEKYKSGYSILDFNFSDSNSFVECLYRKYIHSRIEFDKDTELAKDGKKLFRIKNFNVKTENISNIKGDKSEHTKSSLAKEHTQDDFSVENVMKLYIQETNKLTYNSTKEEFDYVKQLEKELFEQISVPLNDKIQNIPALQDKLIESIFTRTYSSESLNSALLNDIQIARDDKHIYSWYERKVIINAITLSLLSFKTFNPKKIDLLIDFLTDFEDNVWQSALVGLTIALLHHHNKWERFSNLKKRLSTLQQLTNVQIGLLNIEQILRLELYKSSFFQPEMYKLSFFNNPMHCFLPFYDRNPIINKALNSQTQDAELDTTQFEKDMSLLPFIDSYKYVLCLAAENGSLKKEKLDGEKYNWYINNIKISAVFRPYQNLITEYYNYLNHYPEINLVNVFSKGLSLNQNKLKDIILDKHNAIEITAESQMHHKNYSVAIQTLAKIIETDDNHFEAHWKSAKCFLKLEKPNAFNALKHLMKLYNINKTNTSVLLKIAECHNILKEKEKEFFFLDSAQSASPDDRRLFNALGTYYNENKMHNEALDIYKKGVKLYPTNYFIIVGTSDTYYNLGDFKLALKYSLRAEQFVMKEEKSTLYNNIAELYLCNKKYDDAIKYANKLLLIEPDNEYNIMLLGRTYIFGPNNDIMQARTFIQKSISKKKHYYSLGNLGHIELISGNIELATKSYKESITLFNSIDEFKECMDADEPLITDTGVSIELYHSIRDGVINESGKEIK